MQKRALFGQIIGIVLHVHNINFLESQPYNCQQKLKDSDLYQRITTNSTILEPAKHYVFFIGLSNAVLKQNSNMHLNYILL